MNLEFRLTRHCNGGSEQFWAFENTIFYLRIQSNGRKNQAVASDDVEFVPFLCVGRCYPSYICALDAVSAKLYWPSCFRGLIFSSRLLPSFEIKAILW